MRRRRRSRIMVHPVSFLEFGPCSLLKAATVVDAAKQTLAEFLNPIERPAWGRAVGEPTWTDAIEARFREAVLDHARTFARGVAVIFDPGPGRGERVALLSQI